MVLGFSARSFRKDRERLRQNFVTARQADVHELASDLEDRLLDLEAEGRVIEALIGRTYESSGSDREVPMGALRASFDALATVIRPYRTLVLLPPDRPEPLVVAVDPTESPAIAQALVQMTSARDPGVPRLRGLSGPVELAGGARVLFL